MSALPPKALNDFVVILRHHGAGVTRDALVSRYGLAGKPLTANKLLRIAKDQGFKAARKKLSPEKMLDLGEAYPALAVLRDGGTAVLSGVRKGEEGERELVLYDKTGEGAPFVFLSPQETRARFTGEVLLFRKKKLDRKSVV